jgi:biopolymer transport protein ExbB
MIAAAAAMLAVATLAVAPAAAQDAREAARKAEQDRKEAEARARQVEQEIMNDRSRLLAEVEKLEAQQKQLEADVAGLEKAITAGENKHEKLTDEWETKELEFKEISGNVRVVARDVETMLLQSQLSALAPGRVETISPLLETGYFPDIHDITGMVGVIFDEVERSGQVGFVAGSYVGRDGEDTEGDVLTLGKFTAIYNDGEETGFLSYSPESMRFFALSNLPPRGMAGNMEEYTEGESEQVPIDISGGAALRTISHQTSLMDQLRAGGILVWPIGAIALAVLVIVVSKFFFLNRVHGNTDKFMNEVNTLAADGDWEGCKEIVKKHKGKNWPVINVIRDGLKARREDRETLESVLQESILRELPRLEKGLAMLAVFGAVAPLLGLLGTVTGMIDTFRVITLFGTGDPKLMSGGISEALVTTELGLAVAIPTMLFHTWLSRRVNTIVGDMEEKAVAMTNIIQKDQKQNGSIVASA